MKKVLLASCCLILSVGLAVAQTQPVQYGEHQADIELKKATDTSAEFEISNPNGSERASVRIEQKADGEVEMISTDKNTGKVLTHITGVKGERVDSVTVLPNGEYREIHMQKTGEKKEDINATIKAKSSDFEVDMKVNNGVAVGSFSKLEDGYRQKVTMFSNGKMKLEVSDEKTKELLFVAVGDDKNTKLYDANKNLVAEGDSENPTIYDKKAWEEFNRITEDDDDED